MAKFLEEERSPSHIMWPVQRKANLNCRWKDQDISVDIIGTHGPLELPIHPIDEIYTHGPIGCCISVLPVNDAMEGFRSINEILHEATLDQTHRPTLSERYRGIFDVHV